METLVFNTTLMRTYLDKYMTNIALHTFYIFNARFFISVFNWHTLPVSNNFSTA